MQSDGSDQRVLETDEEIIVDIEAPTIDLTVVLNVHHEGKLAHPTIRALLQAAEYAAQAGTRVEVIAVLDRPDDATAKYAHSRLPEVFDGYRLRIITVDNGDLSLSRNDGVAAAVGTYVALCDGDNIVSRNWLAHSVATLAAEAAEIVVHPEYIVSFEARDTIWRIRSSRDPVFDALALAQFNFWDATCVAARSTFTRVPYAPTPPGSGFGPEDWHWNLETLAIGIDHVVVPESVLFYRVKKSGSLLAQHQASDALLPRTEFLKSPESALRINAHNARGEVSTTPETRRLSMKRRGFEAARSFAAVGYRAGSRVLGSGRRARVLMRGLRQTLVDFYYEPSAAPRAWGGIPEWLMREWRRIQEIEPQLYPSVELLSRIGYADPIVTRFVDTYWELLERLGTRIDYLFVVPWLKTGGADKVILHYAKALGELDPDAQVVVLGTEPGDSNWAGLLGSNARFVQVPDQFHRLNSLEQEQLLGTLLVQTAPRVIHLVNSHTGYRVLARYSHAITSASRTFVSIFCLDRTPEGEVVHYILDDFRAYGDIVDGFLTDNRDIADWFIETYDSDRERFRVHYQPFDGFAAERPGTGASVLDSDGVMNVVWAARFDRQKRLDMLVEVARAAEAADLQVRFHVYGSPVMGQSGMPAEIPANVIVHGPFDGGLSSLPSGRFGAFLLTSEWEGLPNTLLEAAALDLVVIAPDVGGVRELVTAETGHLVPSFDDVGGYVAALRAVIEDPDESSRRACALRELVRERHTWERFLAAIRSTPGYLEREPVGD